MNPRILASITLSFLTVLALTGAGCGASNSSGATHGRFDPVPGFGGHGADDDDDDGSTPGDDDDDDDGSTNPEVTPTPDPEITPDPEVTPTPDPEVCTPTAEDADCDGIPDVIDNIPCQSYTLTISNTDVSSAEILLNGSEVAGTNDFPTTDVLEMKINPVIGLNDLTVAGKLAGSPGDMLHFVTTDGDGVLLFEETVTRSNGNPQPVSLQFTIDASCAAP